MKQVLPFILVFFLFAGEIAGREYFVSVSGNNTNPGSREQPFLTIQKAADVMQPGDVCIVRAGTYREWVKPARGGNSELNRIVYKAAPGEEVIIKGSEIVTNWKKQEGNVWMAEIPDTFFGNFNPFKTNISGNYIRYGRDYHLGEVYLNGEPLKERTNRQDMEASPKTFFIEDTENTTRIYANFRGIDPTRELLEINVRECIFFPEIKGLQYITVSGFKMMHAAANWAYFRAFQHALLGTYWGKHWIIENNIISDARCSAIVCGNDPSGENEGFDVETVGHHIVRNNEIRRCGQAAIHGFKGWARSIIEGNLIEDINTKNEFGGFETGGIKIHCAVDLTIKNNIIRNVRIGEVGQYAGIWLDWSAQGCRVTGNIVYNSTAPALFLQNGHGGTVLVDNNIFEGEIRTSMANCIYVHNLFVNCNWNYQFENFSPVFYKPHTGIVAGQIPIAYQNDINYNNIYIQTGTDEIPEYPGFRFNRNVYWQGALPYRFGDSESIVKPEFIANVILKTLSNGVELQFLADDSLRKVKPTLIDFDFVGINEITGQGLDDWKGNRMAVDTDILGSKRNMKRLTAGPFGELNSGKNRMTFIAGKNF
jgi:alpha-L-arabinofuranosidase